MTTNGTGGGSTFRFIFAEFNMTRLREVAKLGGGAVSLLAVFFFFFFLKLQVLWDRVGGRAGVRGGSSDPLCDGINWCETLVTFQTRTSSNTLQMEWSRTEPHLSLSLSLYLAQCIPEGGPFRRKMGPFHKRQVLCWVKRSVFYSELSFHKRATSSTANLIWCIFCLLVIWGWFCCCC